MNLIHTDPRGYIEVAKQVNNSNDDFWKTVKFIKAWRNSCKEKYDDFKLKSFHIEQVIIILSSIFSQKKHALIKMTIKKYLKQIFSKPFFLYFHSCNSDKNTQIADYCGWAIYRKWTDGEMRPYSVIENKIKNEFDMFRLGNSIYYEYGIKKWPPYLSFEETRGLLSARWDVYLIT